MTEIAFSGELTQRDFARLNWLASRRLFLMSWPLTIVLGVWLMLTSGWRTAAAPLLIAPVTYVLQHVMVRRRWHSNQIIQRRVSGVVSDEVITWNVEGISAMKVTWAMLIGSRRSKSLVLVYQAPNQVFCFPRHFFVSEADWTTFRTLVAEKFANR